MRKIFNRPEKRNWDTTFDIDAYTSLGQAVQALDHAAAIAVKKGETSLLIDIASGWGKVSEFIMTNKLVDDDVPGVDKRVGFQPPKNDSKEGGDEYGQEG